jgi:hypothetical protein
MLSSDFSVEALLHSINNEVATMNENNTDSQISFVTSASDRNLDAPVSMMSSNIGNESNNTDTDDSNSTTTIGDVDSVSSQTQQIMTVDENEIVRMDTIMSSSLSLRYSQICASVASLFSTDNSQLSSSSADEEFKSNSSTRTTSSSISVSHGNPNDDNANKKSPELLSDSFQGLITSTTYNNNNNSSQSVDLHSIDTTSECSTVSSATVSRSNNDLEVDPCHGMNISRHAVDSYLNVGRNLMQQQPISHSASHTVNIDGDVGIDDDELTSSNLRDSSWYRNLKEDDWDKFTKNAEQVLCAIRPDLDLNSDALEEGSGGGLGDRGTCIPMVEPPSLNEKENHCYIQEDMTITSTRRQEIQSLLFPAEFTCPLCTNLLVGTIVLDCGCRKSTCCIPCLEQFHKENNTQKTCKADESDGFVIIDWSEVHEQKKYDKTVNSQAIENSCPSCQGSYNHAIPCHTLDVAVLNAVRNINAANHKDVTLDEIQSFQSIHYQRIRRWREEFYRRKRSKFDTRKQLLLSKIISEQEAIMDDFKRRKEINTTKQKCLGNAGEMPLMVAAFVGLNIFLFRKWAS